MPLADNEATFRIEIEVDPGSAANTAQNLANGIRQNFTGLESVATGVEGAFKKTAQSLSTTRYALYDVAGTLGAVGAGLIGLSAATVGVAVAWERDFAQVIRTVGSEIGFTSPKLDELRAKLVDLTTTIPVSFSELAGIAALGGQLGIAADGIDEFTGVVAKVGTTTDLSFEQAGTAIGRFSALLGVPASEFENLASSILKVGINSVATESQIVNIATQISSMADYAGFTADQVVGMSGALASVGAQPEISRGTLTRAFTNMSAAIGEGGEKLDGWAKLAKVSSDEFASAFGTEKFAGLFQNIIQSLGDMQGSGEDANLALRELGITSVRDVPLLMRLGLAQDVVTKAFSDAESGYRENTELADQYAQIAETTASKLGVLANSFMALLDAVGSNTLGPLGFFLDMLTDVLNTLRQIAENPVGGFFMGLATVIAGVAGAAALLGAGLARTLGGLIGLRQAMLGLASANIVGNLSGAAGAIQLTGASARVATGLVRAFALALRTAGIAALALLGLEIQKGMRDIADGMMGVDKTAGALVDQLMNTTIQVRNLKAEGNVFDILEASGGDGLPDWMFQLNGWLTDIGAASFLPPNALTQIAQLDNEFEKMISSGNIGGVRHHLERLGLNADQVAKYLPGTASALRDAGYAADGAAESSEAVANELSVVQQEAAEAKAEIDGLRDAILNFNGAALDAETAGIAFDAALFGIQQISAETAGSLTGMDAASIALRSSFVEGEQKARAIAAALVDAGGSADEAMGYWNAMRESVIQARIAKGEDEAAARSWADRVLGTAAEAEAAINGYSDAVDDVPDTADTDLRNNAAGKPLRDVQTYTRNITGVPNSKNTDLRNNVYNGPYQAIWDYVGAVNSIPSFRETVINTHYSVTGNRPMAQGPGGGGGMVFGAATGGYIRGPGSGTSDSIPAWLSNGEFVIKAATVSKYGTAFLHALNAGRIPKFAQGGQVSGSTGGLGSGIMTGVVELGPKTMQGIASRMAQQINVNLDDSAISRAAERGNRRRRATGDL